MPAPFSHLVSDVAELRGLDYPEPKPAAWAKEIGVLDEHCRSFLAKSPLAMWATCDARGRCDVSPRGGPPGFARVLDAGRIAWADLSGNRRIDSLRNVLENPHVGLLFLIPGLKETLRVNGRAYLTRDPETLAATRVPGRDPDLAVGIAVETAFVQCAKALIRSELWNTDSWPDALPSAARMLRDHVGLDVPVSEVEDSLAESYRSRLW